MAMHSARKAERDENDAGFSVAQPLDARTADCAASIRLDDAEQRFWKRVAKGSHCWSWLGAHVSASCAYGRVRFGGKLWVAHRLAWTLANGPIPEGLDLQVCHHCDNPLCVRPDHLFLGTALENTADSIAKGRRVHLTRPRGPRSATPRDREVCRLGADGLRVAEIVKLTGVARRTVYRILRRARA